MAQQKRGPINGLDPLIYTGGLPNLVVMDRRPTPADYAQYFLGHWWIIPQLDESPDEEVWVLVSKRNGVAKWKKLHGGGGPTPPVQSQIINKIYLTTLGAGTYTPTEGMLQCYVECVGGGGGSFLGANSAAVGGGGGGYSAKLYSNLDIGSNQPYFVGMGGAGKGDPYPGNSGEDTTFGVGDTLIIGKGGKSASQEFNTFTPRLLYFSPGGLGIGGDLNIQGGDGENYYLNSGFGGVGPVVKGGDSQYGKGGSFYDNAGTLESEGGKLYGGGAGQLSATPSYADGAQGIIIITEYLA